MRQPIDFKTANYFTGMPYVLGFIIAPIGFLVIFSPQWIIGAILLITGVIILTTHYRLKIDRDRNQYDEYIFLLGMKSGLERKRFSSIEYIFIKKAKVTQTLNSRASSTTIEKFQYDAFLKFSEDDKAHLMTLENKSTLLKRLNVIAAKLSIKVLDYSNEAPIDLR